MCNVSLQLVDQLSLHKQENIDKTSRYKASYPHDNFYLCFNDFEGIPHSTCSVQSDTYIVYVVCKHNLVIQKM